MIAKSTGFTLLVLITLCLAAAPPGSRGTIDFRYPDYIVDPLPKCPSEGVFPHPRNCTWYYQCTDVYQVGIHRRFYFECEPGTVFSDELDQCIHPFNPKNPCKVVGKPHCTETFVRCKFYYCPTTTDKWEYIGKVCQSAYSKCSDGTEEHYCRGPLYYEVATKDCVESPRKRKCLDKAAYESRPTTPSTTTPSTTTPSTTTPSTTTQEPEEDCYYSVVGCKDYRCPESVVKVTLCRKRFMTCNKNVVTFFCSGNQYYNFGTKQCVAPPSESRCVELPPANAGTGTVTSLVDPQSLTFSFTVECSPDNTRPKNKQLVDYFCRDYRACVREAPIKMNLCDKYLQCLYEEKTKKWSATITNCPPKLYFSYEKDICIQKPKATC